MKILVIDDDEMIRESICDLLEMEDFQIISANNGLSGVELAHEHLPDLVVCDINMPKLGGHEVLSRLRQNSSTNQIPFMFLTAYSDDENRDLALRMGANAYLTKPLSARNLLEKIGMLLSFPLQHLY